MADTTMEVRNPASSAGIGTSVIRRVRPVEATCQLFGFSSSGMATRRFAKAHDMVRNLKGRGGNDGAETWLRIIVAIEVLQRGSAT